ncbi:MAG: DUF11 domain-containing protein, partial [Aeromicrobium sp.]|nr:DUF11 domain-containing protein [Burkholderiales bacterium]
MRRRRVNNAQLARLNVPFMGLGQLAQKSQNPQEFLQIVATQVVLRGFFALLCVVLAFTASSAFAPLLAQTPAPGTTVINIANGALAVGPQPLNVTSNPVSTVVAAKLSTTITKAFGAAEIDSGASTSLAFTITNAVGNPAQSGVAFSDTLPVGLQFTTNATATIAGAGCVGATSFANNNQFNVTALTMAAGTASCTVTISGVTNAVGQSNASCAANPAAFTNSTSNLSGLVNVQNAVTPQCLVIKGQLTLTKAFGAAEITSGANTSLTFTIRNASGNPTQRAIAFTDTLPEALRFGPSATIAVSGVGCSGSANLVGSTRVSVSGLSMNAGAEFCFVTVSAITNQADQLNPSCAANPERFTNAAKNFSEVAGLVNGVTPQCLVVKAPPTLTKAFTETQIRDGEVAGLKFSLRAAAGHSGFTGMAFTDTLPAGLRLSPSPTSAVTGGCTAQVTFVAPSQVRVSAASLPAGVTSCDIVVNGVTNVAGQSNASCAGNPTAFTNNAASISELRNVVNGVLPSCLIVERNPALYMEVVKSISRTDGESPFTAESIRLTYTNATGGLAANKRNVIIADTLPTGMTYVPGTLRLTVGTSAVALPDASGEVTFLSRRVSYTASATNVSVNLASIPADEVGVVSFDVAIAAGLPRLTVLPNTAQLRYTNSVDASIGPTPSNTVQYRILNTVGVTLRGMTIGSAEPGSTVQFDNILTNVGTRADTFNITLSASTFPQGSRVNLLKSDGTTLLADTNGDGVPDTGIVEAGATYKIVVKVELPVGVAGGPFKLTKTARSVSNTLINARDDDIVTAVARICKVTLESDNRGTVKAGEYLDYAHTLTNVGTCNEIITIPADVLRSSAGWTILAVIDNPVPGGASIVGTIDPTDTRLVAGGTISLAPGARATLFVRVTAPANAAIGAIDNTDLRLTTARNETLLVRDNTTVQSTNFVDGEIRGFFDSRLLRRTAWTTIGKEFYFQVSASACNAQPDVIERRTIVITGPNGEREELVAVETGPNTNIFAAPAMPTSRASVVAGDGVLQGQPFDTFDVEVIGCSRRITTTITLIEPAGVVFDSRTNMPVAGATVRIVTATNSVCTQTLAQVQRVENQQLASSPNTIVTKDDGRFDFPLVPAGDYCISVTPPNGYAWPSAVPAGELAAGRVLLANGPFSTSGGSYGGVFSVDQQIGAVVLDIPMDTGAIRGLVIKKESQRATVEVGEFNDYTVTLNNGSGLALADSDVIVSDSLPFGFSYVAGSASVDGKAIVDPRVVAGAALQFNVGKMAKDAQRKLTYRVRIGPAALRGDGINRVFATYRVGSTGQSSQSNTAYAKVAIVGGVFSDQAYVVGKVFADCSKDGLQRNRYGEAASEVGIPGIRLMLQDGSSAITDAEGKYSFYGLSPRTHVLKIDRTTLPAGVSVEQMAILGNRNLGKGDSRILDLKVGEMHKANFAIQSCEVDVVEEIEQRRRAASKLTAEMDGRLQPLTTTPGNTSPTSNKSAPASGVLGGSAGALGAPSPAAAPQSQASVPTKTEATNATNVAPAAEGVSGFATLAKPQSLPIAPARGAGSPAPVGVLPLEELLPSLDNKLGFIGVANDEILKQAQTSLRVKGVLGTTFKLVVNGAEVPGSKVGKKTSLESTNTQAWEYFGIELRNGQNVLELSQIDGFGVVRGTESIKLVAPGALNKVVVEFSDKVKANGGAIADGRTPVKVTVRLTDAKGIPVTERTSVTLTASVGRWDVPDLNPGETGVQTFIEDGKAEFLLMPPNEPTSG